MARVEPYSDSRLGTIKAPKDRHKTTSGTDHIALSSQPDDEFIRPPAPANPLIKAALLDRDGTINIDGGYTFRTEDLEFIPGAIQGLQLLSQAGFRLFVITNQSGVGRGYFDDHAVNSFHDEMSKQLARHDVTIESYRFCPHHPQASVISYRQTCQCRKPGSAMFRDVASEFHIDLGRSFAIGDRVSDIEPIIGMGGRGVVLGEEYDGAPVTTTSVYRAADLREAAKLILHLGDSTSGSRPTGNT